MTDSLAELLQTAVLAALQAGETIRAGFDKPRIVRKKGPRDIVTDTDRLAQEAALSVIWARHPDHAVLAEEDPAGQPDTDGRWPIPPGVTWFIDPLDGTSNFANGIPFVCVSVGAAVDGEPVAGAVFDPLRHELFVASKGGGALLNDRPLPSIPVSSLSDSIVGLDWAHEAHHRQRLLAAATGLALRCRTVRGLGCAALALAYVACGRLQAYVNFGIKPWDVAAGAVIVREVGGTLFHPDGGAWRLDAPAVVTGHPSLVDEIEPLIRSYADGGSQGSQP